MRAASIVCALSVAATATVAVPSEYEPPPTVIDHNQYVLGSHVYQSDDRAGRQQGSGDNVSDLVISKDARVSVDATVRFDFRVDNEGPDEATGVVVIDVLPECTEYVSDGCGGTETNGTWEWEIGDLGTSFDARKCSLYVDASGCLGKGVQTNTATVNGDQVDPDLDDNTSEVTFEAMHVVADLAVNKEVRVEGTLLSADVEVRNLGPDDATEVVVRAFVTDARNACLGYVKDDCGGLPPSFRSGWQWPVGELAAGASRSCSVQFDGSRCIGEGEQSLWMRISGFVDDPDPDNDSTDEFIFEIQDVPALTLPTAVILISMLALIAARLLRQVRA